MERIVFGGFCMLSGAVLTGMVSLTGILRSLSSLVIGAAGILLVIYGFYLGYHKISGGA